MNTITPDLSTEPNRLPKLAINRITAKCNIWKLAANCLSVPCNSFGTSSSNAPPKPLVAITSRILNKNSPNAFNADFIATVIGIIASLAIISALSFMLLVIPVIVLEDALRESPKRSFIPSISAFIATLAGTASLPRLRNCSCVRPNFSLSISYTGIPASVSCLTSAVISLPYVLTCPRALVICSILLESPCAEAAAIIPFIMYIRFFDSIPYATKRLAADSASVNANGDVAAKSSSTFINSVASFVSPKRLEYAIFAYSNCLVNSHVALFAA